MKSKIIFIYIFLIFIGCKPNLYQESKGKSNLRNYKLENYLPENQAESLYKIMDYFDIFLSKNTAI